MNDAVRLSINLAPDVASALTIVAAGRDVSATEAVRMAISFLWFVDTVYLSGDCIEVVKADGSRHEVLYP